MSFSEIASFYYIESITKNNYYLDFKEGAGPQKSAKIAVGDWTMTELASAVEDALNQYGTYTYTVTFLRDERKFEIISSNTTTLLISTGTHLGTSAYSLLGFTGSDTSSTTIHLGNTQAGSEYIPQFPLQDYVDQEDFQKAVSASINKSANGSIEVVKFGTEKFYEFEIMFITDIDQGNSGVIRTNLTGLQEARLFMRFIITKRKLEMMLDYTDKDIFVTILLEKTEADSNGTGYRLQELYTKGLPGYFQTGRLTFRLIE